MAAHNPREFTRTPKTKIIGNKLTIKSFNSIAYRWVLDQYKLFGTIQDTKCDGSYNMPEANFVEVIIAELENNIPTFTDAYNADELKNEPWDMGHAITEGQTQGTGREREVDCRAENQKSARRRKDRDKDCSE